MKKKHIIYTLSLLSLTVSLSNINNSNAFFKLDNFVVRTRAVSDTVDIKDKNLLKAINNQLGRGEVLNNVTVADMERLTILNARKRNISSIEGLEYAVNLNELWIDNNQISDVSPLTNLVNLRGLGLTNNNISDISYLKNLVNLNQLWLDDNQISDVSQLTNLVNLIYLGLSNNNISDISLIKDLTNLIEIYLYDNNISNISPIKNLKKLEVFCIQNNQISDISTIDNLVNLGYLDLSNNNISNISCIKNLKNLSTLKFINQKPIIEVGDFNTLNVCIDNPIISLFDRVSNITDISDNGVYENGELKWSSVPLGNHSRTFNFTENITIGSMTTIFSGTATLNFNVIDEEAPEADHTSEFDVNDFGIYTTVTANDLGVGVDYLMHKGIRQSLPYRFKYDVYDNSNNIVEVYDLVGNKAEYQVKLKDNDIPVIEEGLNALSNKSNSNAKDISYFRTIINDLDESMNKDLLQDRLNSIYPNILSLDRKSITSNMDIYIKSENMLQMTIDTNSVTFDDFNGIEDIIKENIINININSSLPYQLNSYLPVEIQNADKTNTMDKRILNIKENGEANYKEFANINEKILLKDNCPAGNDLIHGVDIKLRGGIAHEKDVYKTTIKFEAEQK